jgi:hypothetical protein
MRDQGAWDQTLPAAVGFREYVITQGARHNAEGIPAWKPCALHHPERLRDAGNG